MKRIKVKSEAINGMIHALEYDIMSLAYHTNDPEVDDISDMEVVVNIHDRINDILTEISCIESERDRMRKEW